MRLRYIKGRAILNGARCPVMLGLSLVLSCWLMLIVAARASKAPSLRFQEHLVPVRRDETAPNEALFFYVSPARTAGLVILTQGTLDAFGSLRECNRYLQEPVLGQRHILQAWRASLLYVLGFAGVSFSSNDLV